MSSLQDRSFSRRSPTLSSADLVLVIVWGLAGLLLHAVTASIASAGAFTYVPDEYSYDSHGVGPDMGTEVALRALFD